MTQIERATAAVLEAMDSMDHLDVIAAEKYARAALAALLAYPQQDGTRSRKAFTGIRG